MEPGIYLCEQKGFKVFVEVFKIFLQDGTFDFAWCYHGESRAYDWLSTMPKIIGPTFRN